MSFRIVDFTGKFECDELKIYGSYHYPKFKIKAAANLLIALTPVFGPSLLILSSSSNLLCLGIKDSFILMDKDTFFESFDESRRTQFHQIVELKPIGEPIDVVLAVLHSITMTGKLHESLVSIKSPSQAFL